jgi:G3E family GTPase
MTVATSPVQTVMEAPKHGLPVTIITGFLGSGKTTLLNHILTNQQGLKTAVLVNEFGEIGIDNELIVKTDEDGTLVELSNGCICCTINEDLMNAVYKVLEREDKVDYLVVETTGLADPLPVALTFLGSELRDMTRLDSIITVVDSENFSLDLFNSQAAESQIAYGDIILLNKSDLVSEDTLDQLELRIRDLKDGARILRTTKGNVPLSLLLSVGLFESDRYYEPKDKAQDAGHNHDHAGHDHAGHNHDDHAGHDHAAHDHDDHTNCDHDHGKCEHDDHAGHDHGAHDHAGHDHAQPYSLRPPSDRWLYVALYCQRQTLQHPQVPAFSRQPDACQRVPGQGHPLVRRKSEAPYLPPLRQTLLPRRRPVEDRRTQKPARPDRPKPRSRQATPRSRGLLDDQKRRPR